jgi:hypothetical protein
MQLELIYCIKHNYCKLLESYKYMYKLYIFSILREYSTVLEVATVFVVS